METVKEIRCLNHHFRMFAKVMAVDKDTNWIEVKCRECSKSHSKKIGKKTEVYHYYNLLGEFMETKIKPIEKEVFNNGR